MKLAEISIYPVKSCRGISVDAAAIDRFGPKGDRRWMIVTPGGAMLTQRTLPQMALIQVEQISEGLRLRYRDARIAVSYPREQAPRCRVQVWEDTVDALDAGPDVADWLSGRLGCDCRLVFMPADSIRRVDGAYASDGETVGFADGFPLLLISRASLEELNSRLEAPVPMNRFRPNLVISGCTPFAEDDWSRIRIGEMEFTVAKACSRCAIPSIIQETGERDPHINRMLASFRRLNGQIYFGQNLLYRLPGRLKTGDPVAILA